MASLISFDYQNCLSKKSSSNIFLSPEDIQKKFPQLLEVQQAIQKKTYLGEIPSLNPEDHLDDLEDIHQRGKNIFQNFENIILLGIGGSALAPATILESLLPSIYHFKKNKTPRLFICDNCDQEEWEAIAEICQVEKTHLIVISKSGKTVETLSAFQFFRKKFSNKENYTFITDPNSGPLRELSKKESFFSFSIPPQLGGRYSVHSAVGLLPAACLGLNPKKFLEGCQTLSEQLKNTDFQNNAPFLSACIHHLFEINGLNIRVLFPYEEKLETYSEWFCQLWAESLGKHHQGNRFGQTPVRAMGATDQHSQCQLYLEGPRDKVINFFKVKHLNTEKINGETVGLHEIDILNKISGSELLDIEYRATKQALTKAGVPNLSYQLEDLNEKSLGALFYFAELETIVAGYLQGLNPFDQPAVESIKKYIKGMLNVPGYEEFKKELEEEKTISDYLIKH